MSFEMWDSRNFEYAQWKLLHVSKYFTFFQNLEVTWVGKPWSESMIVFIVLNKQLWIKSQVGDFQ
jgi:hypothetical protein